MAIQRHPIDSYEKKLNFWEEFPDYKLHKVFGALWRNNKNAGKLKESSLFMWALTLCYDRKSSYFAQPEHDKWEVVSEDFFGDTKFMHKLALGESQTQLIFPLGIDLFDYILEFEKSIDTPLGISLRLLEKKLAERTRFIMETDYSMDYYEVTDAGRNVLKKGTADQLDRMFRDTGKINDLIQKALDDLRTSEAGGTAKGGGVESLGDGDKTF